MKDLETDNAGGASLSNSLDFDLDEEALERANAAIARLKESYISEWAPASIDEMYEALAAAMRRDADCREQMERLYRLAHDMKGQGGTFDFAILTTVGESICRLTADRDLLSDGEFTVVRAHVDAARTIIRERLDGEGGAAGRELLAGLQAMTRAQLH